MMNRRVPRLTVVLFWANWVLMLVFCLSLLLWADVTFAKAPNSTAETMEPSQPQNSKETTEPSQQPETMEEPLQQQNSKDTTEPPQQPASSEEPLQQQNSKDTTEPPQQPASSERSHRQKAGASPKKNRGLAAYTRRSSGGGSGPDDEEDVSSKNSSEVPSSESGSDGAWTISSPGSSANSTTTSCFSLLLNSTSSEGVGCFFHTCLLEPATIFVTQTIIRIILEDAPLAFYNSLLGIKDQCWRSLLQIWRFLRDVGNFVGGIFALLWALFGFLVRALYITWSSVDVYKHVLPVTVACSGITLWLWWKWRRGCRKFEQYLQEVSGGAMWLCQDDRGLCLLRLTWGEPVGLPRDHFSS